MTHTTARHTNQGHGHVLPLWWAWELVPGALRRQAASEKRMGGRIGQLKPERSYPAGVGGHQAALQYGSFRIHHALGPPLPPRALPLPDLHGPPPPPPNNKSTHTRSNWLVPLYSVRQNQNIRDWRGRANHFPLNTPYAIKLIEKISQHKADLLTKTFL